MLKSLNAHLKIIAAVILLVFGVGVVGGGYLFTQDIRNLRTLVEQLYSNFGIELFSIAITVLVIETLNERRAKQERKTELILQMGSPDNSFAVEAVRILRQKGWLEDGSLRDARLSQAKLSESRMFTSPHPPTPSPSGRRGEKRAFEVPRPEGRDLG